MTCWSIFELIRVATSSAAPKCNSVLSPCCACTRVSACFAVTRLPDQLLQQHLQQHLHHQQIASRPSTITNAALSFTALTIDRLRTAKGREGGFVRRVRRGRLCCSPPTPSPFPLCSLTDPVDVCHQVYCFSSADGHAMCVRGSACGLTVMARFHRLGTGAVAPLSWLCLAGAARALVSQLVRLAPSS